MKNLKNILNESLSSNDASKQINNVVKIIKEVFTNWEDENGNDIYAGELGNFTFDILDAIYLDGDNPGAINDIESWLKDNK